MVTASKPAAHAFLEDAGLDLSPEFARALEMDAPERMPAGGMAKAWHNDMPFVTETWRGC